MRLFFALEPEQRSAVDIASWRDRQLPLAARPVPLANLHITLAFLGEISVHRLERLCLSVEEYLRRKPVSGGRLNLDQVGYWPKPRICWLGPTQWPAELNQLAEGLERLGNAEGGKRKRSPFQPHITLYRACENAPPAPASPPSFSFDYQDFALMESRQGRRGVSYHPLAHWQLR